MGGSVGERSEAADQSFVRQEQMEISLGWGWGWMGGWPVGSGWGTLLVIVRRQQTSRLCVRNKWRSLSKTTVYNSNGYLTAYISPSWNSYKEPGPKA